MPPEAKLSAKLGVPRTVIREAMRVLSARGLIEVSQGRQPRIKPADPQDIVRTLESFLQRSTHSLLHLIEVRRPLESEIAALAARRATSAQIAALEAANRRLAAAERIEARVDADMRFHDLLVEAAGNPVFILLLKALVNLMRRSRFETLSRTGVARALTGHQLILKAVQHREPEAARAAMLLHLSQAEEDLQKEP